jgi:hypothetical protein
MWNDTLIYIEIINKKGDHIDNIVLDISYNMSVREIKQQIEDKTRIKVDNQYLMTLHSKYLANDDIIGSVVTPYATLFLVKDYY